MDLLLSAYRCPIACLPLFAYIPRFPTNTSPRKARPKSMSKIPITVAHGDGIGPEIMAATLHILEESGADLEIETIDIGEKVYLAGNSSGIEPSSWDSLRRTKVFLKAPITTPQGGGFKSLNVTVRKTLGLYANVRPCVSYHPFVETKHPGMDVVIVRENEEDVYGGIEYRQTDQVTQCLKLISRPGSEKIVRYAFEYARRNNRKKVTCFTKDNIMKITDGLFHKVFDEIAAAVSRDRERTLDRGHRRGQAGGHADRFRRDRDAESLRRCVVGRGRANRRLGRSGRLGKHRREGGDVRSHPRFSAAARGTESGKPVRAAFGRGDDAGPYRPDQRGGASAQRLAAHPRRWRSYLRHLQRRRQQRKSRHERVCRSSGQASRRKAAAVQGRRVQGSDQRAVCQRNRDQRTIGSEERTGGRGCVSRLVERFSGRSGCSNQ